MHPTVRQYLMTAMVADVHRQARRDALVRQARRLHTPQRTHSLTGRTTGLFTRRHWARLNASSRSA